MALNTLSLQFAEITAVDTDRKVLSAQSRLDGSVITDIPIETPLHLQYIPVVGQQVILIRSDFFTAVLAVMADRPFDAPIKPGEIMVEGSGGGFYYANQSGDVMLADSAMSNVLKLISTVGIQVVGDALSVTIKGIGQLSVVNDKIELTKVSGTPGVPVAKVTITNDKVDVQAPNVSLGSQPVGGVVISNSGVVGPYSVDWMGLPIPSSQAVQAALLPTPIPPTP